MKFNMKSRYILLALIFGVLFFSCEDFFETTLELETPEYEEQIVVSALLDNDIKKSIFLSKTVGINGNLEDSEVNNADIKLTSEGGVEFFIENIDPDNESSYINYFLKDSMEFQPEESYTLEILTSDGKKANCTATMPPTPQLISAIYKEGGGTTLDGDKLEAIDIVIKDDPSEENFYRINLVTGMGIHNSFFLESNDPAAEESADYRSLIINDVQFNGEEYRLQILHYSYLDSLEDVFIEFSAISEDQYKFDKLLNSFQENEDNPFNTVAQLHSNIEGGLGLFAIENTIVMKVTK